LAGTPVVVATEHSIGETHLERRRMTQGVRALYLATDKFCDETIAVSDAVATRLINWGMPARKISVIPNGVDFQRVAFDPVQRAKVRAEHGIDDSTFVIGVLGRLDANKRFDLVIEAAAPLLGEKAKLLVVGGGAELENLRAAAGRNQVSQHVVFAGERHDVAAVLSAFDLFVAASAQETFGLSVLEALANGLPVLYTTCPALDGVPTERATRVPGEVGGMRAAMAAEIEFPRVRAEEAEVRRRYGIESVTERIDELYLRLHQRRSGLAPVGRP
ncbi:glycosyltransferase, partial [Klebsiella pneumoniae]|nr:glycosyltransferase [Klebsiella pneumoniae]